MPSQKLSFVIGLALIVSIAADVSHIIGRQGNGYEYPPPESNGYVYPTPSVPFVYPTKTPPPPTIPSTYLPPVTTPPPNTYIPPVTTRRLVLIFLTRQKLFI